MVSGASLVASVLNFFQISFFANIFARISHTLTDWENYETDTLYEDSMIIKSFSFNFINTYISFFFLAFIAETLPVPNPANNPKNFPGDCGAKTCMTALATNLGIILVSGIFLNNLPKLITAYISGTDVNAELAKAAKEAQEEMAKAVERAETERMRIANLDIAAEIAKNTAEEKIKNEKRMSAMSAMGAGVNNRLSMSLSGRSTPAATNATTEDASAMTANEDEDDMDADTPADEDAFENNECCCQPKRVPLVKITEEKPIGLEALKDFKLHPFDIVEHLPKEYMNSVTLFGFMTLFVTALPAAPFIIIFSLLFEMRGDAYRLLELSRRPIPMRANSIGTWQDMLEFVVSASIITNGALIVFTLKLLRPYSTGTRYWIFIGFMWMMFSLQYLMRQAFADIPLEVQIQISRQKHLVSRVINKDQVSMTGEEPTSTL